MKTAWVVCTYTHPGGSITKSLTLPVGITSNTVAVWACPVTASALACRIPTASTPAVTARQRAAGGYGASLKDDYRYFYGATFGMAGRGEAIAREDNFCEIDPNVVDKLRNSCAPFPLQVERARDQAGQTHEGNVCRDHPQHGRRGYLGEYLGRA